ncbi:MAG TPA: hypothetical protein PK167_12310, partial [Prolixibacteraceae bacterium]|nr:hypothetical protein [Prolixibacteraceae bacterium]
MAQWLDGRKKINKNSERGLPDGDFEEYQKAPGLFVLQRGLFLYFCGSDKPGDYGTTIFDLQFAVAEEG